MRAKIIGNRIRLRDLKIGKIAVDENNTIYTKVYVPDPKEVRTMFIKLTDLTDQYNDMIRDSTIVRELTSGEQVVIEI